MKVYIRRKSKFRFFYSRRKRGFGTQEPSPLLPCKDIPSLNEEVQNNGFFSNAGDFMDNGFIEGLPLPFIPDTSQENAEFEFESNAIVPTIKPENDIVLNTVGSLPEDVPNKDMIAIGIKLFNKEPLLTVIQQLTSTLSILRRPRSARESASRKWRTSKSSDPNNSKQKVSHLSSSTSVCCEVIPKTPQKTDKITKFTSKNLLSVVKSLLSVGVLEKAPVKYKKNNLELKGILTISGICCGCSLCNFKQVVSSLKFEKHAGSRSNNQYAHIFLENGISLYALSKELKNVSRRSLGKVIAEKFGYPMNMEGHMEWKGDTLLDHNKGEIINQNHFPDLLDELQECLKFPKGPRSIRAEKPPLHITSDVNKKVFSPMVFRDVNSQHPSVHKKRGVDIASTKELLSLKESTDFTLSDPSQSNIGEVISPNLKEINIENNEEANMSRKRTPNSPLSSVICLLTTGLLEGVLVKYKKNEVDLGGFIKGLGICCSCSSCHFSTVLSSFDFATHGGITCSDPNDHIFVNDKITLSSLVRELGKVSLGLLSGEVIQKLIGCQPNIKCFLAWKESFHDKESILQRTSCDDGKNQIAHAFFHDKFSPVERLWLSASEDNLLLPSVDDVKLNLQGQIEKTLKRREQDFHQQIFDLLNDGSKLSYRSHGKEVLTGYKFGKNILCSCCNVMLSASKFEAHAGHEKRRKPYHSIYTSYSKSLNQIAMFLLLDKSSFEPSVKDQILAYKAGEVSVLNMSYPTGDQIPSRASSPVRFLSRRIMAPCNSSKCKLCGDDNATLNFGNICESTILFCGQCGRLFHVGCLRNLGICDITERPCPSDTWLCSNKCEKVRADLLNFIQGGSMTISESLLNLLRCRSFGSTISDETKFEVHWQLLSGRYLGDKCRSLLEQAKTIFQKAFGAVYKGHRDVLSNMVNGEKGVTEFFGGIFCAVLTVRSVIVSALLLRVFDNHIAELLLAVTPEERRGEGYFRILLMKTEEMLSLIKVENLILSADDQSLPMWVEKFGFTKLNTNQILEYQMNHRILMFENTTMLQKAVPSAVL